MSTDTHLWSFNYPPQALAVHIPAITTDSASDGIACLFRTSNSILADARIGRFRGNGVRDSTSGLSFELLARQFAGTADRFSLLARLFLGRLLELFLELHLTENAFTLKLFFQSPKGLVDIVVANTDLHGSLTVFLELVCNEL